MQSKLAGYSIRGFLLITSRMQKNGNGVKENSKPQLAESIIATRLWERTSNYDRYIVLPAITIGILSIVLVSQRL